MVDMALMHCLPDAKYATWFHNKQNTEQAKREIQHLFSEEPDELHEWAEQDVNEPSRNIIARWAKS